jgi:hypothetical protein
MSGLTLALADKASAFEPGQTVRGELAWNLSEAVHSIEVRLFWVVQGRQSEELGLVEAIPVDHPVAAGRHLFAFTLPAGPYSFSGSLMKLKWAIEAVVKPGGLAERVEIVVAPGAAAVVLPGPI